MELDESIKRRVSVLEQFGEHARMGQIEAMANKKGVDKDELLIELRKYEKNKKYGKQKDKMKFFHSTSLSSAKQIIQDRELLSTREREKRGDTINNVRPNSRHHGVQFTTDFYNDEGKLTSSGYSRGGGASGQDITFVFGEDLYYDPLLDTFEQYPSIDYVSLDKCLAIICNNENDKKSIVDFFEIQGIMNIIVFIKDEFDINITSRDLKKKIEMNKTLDLKDDNDNDMNMAR